MDALKSKGQMYDQIDLGKIQKSGFDLSFDCKGTGSLGRLYPVRCMETLPGDKYQGSTQIAVQFQPLAVPMLSNMHVRTETFYVPNRILWQDWEKFISGGQKLDDTSVVPTVTFSDFFEAIYGPFGLINLLGEDALKTYDLYRLCRTLDASIDVSKQYDYTGVERTVTRTDRSQNGYKGVFWKTDKKDKRATIDSGKDSGSYYDFGDLVSYDVISRDYYRKTSCIRVDNLMLAIKSMREELVENAKKANIYDLVLDSLAALDSLLVYLGNLLSLDLSDTYFNINTSSSGDVIMPIPDVYLPIFDVSDEAVIPREIFLSMSSLGSKYYDPLLPYLKKSLPEEAIFFAPFSSEYITVLQYLYDALRPFVGLGSNIEMLGYHCLTFTDFVLMSFNDFYRENAGDRVAASFANYGFASFANYFGGFLSATQHLSILPLRALYAIWYNYYRDQVLEADVLEPVTISSITSVELLQLLAPRRRCWSKDAFTTALDNTGTGSVVVPVSDTIRRTTSVIKTFDTLTANTSDSASAIVEDIDVVAYTLTSGETIHLPSRYLQQIATGVDSDKSHGGFSLDVMKRAQRVQKWIQKALIYGNRPQDFLFTHFGVRSSDARLQLPEFLCSDSQMCRLDTIVNNTTTAESVAGDKAANAYGYTDGSNLNRFCEEHGFIISFFSVMPSTEYGYGVSRDLRRLSKFDFAFPEFADLGMDGVMQYELCESPVILANVDNPISTYEQPQLNVVFGYQGRYYDYKSKQNEIHGDLRDSDDMYTFARKFNPYDEDSMPKLNRYFVHCRPRLDMFVSDYPLDDQFRFDIHHAQAVERCLPVPSQYL